MIGERIKLARARRGLSLRDLEARIDNLVSAQAIGKYERGEMMPGSRVMMALADALGVSESYLAGQSGVELENVEFRKKKITNRKEEAQVEAAAIDLLERYLEIEEILQVASRSWDRPREGPFPVREMADSESAAIRLREYWKLGTNPIPVPGLAEMLEESGIKVVCLDLPANVSGLTCWVRRKNGDPVPVIVINENHNGERQRFTLCHELGHMIIDAADDIDDERACDRFAEAFLTPADSVWAEIGKHRSSISLGELFSLKELYGVSVQVIAYRLKNLGIINTSAHRGLYAAFARRGWLKPPFPEPLPLPKEEPNRFRRLCFWALAEKAISEAKAAELLGMTVRELNQAMEEPPGGAA